MLALLALMACSAPIFSGSTSANTRATQQNSVRLPIGSTMVHTVTRGPSVPPVHSGMRHVHLANEIQFSPAWPESSAALEVLPTKAPRNLPRKKVYIMAGHANGRGGNGNVGVHGQVEAEVMRDAAVDLAARLEALDRFDVVLGRKGDQRPTYKERIRNAEKIGADVFIELHTDSRGNNVHWADTPSGEVLRSKGEHGFSILYSERGSLADERRDLAANIGSSLDAAGFKAYPGCHYGGTYDAEGTPGVFIDRRGLMMLRKPKVPSIIIETHNAKDFEESLRWREERTAEAFAAAIADGLSELFAE